MTDSGLLAAGHDETLSYANLLACAVVRGDRTEADRCFARLECSAPAPTAGHWLWDGVGEAAPHVTLVLPEDLLAYAQRVLDSLA